MKRTALTLVSYSSSDENDVPAAEAAQPVPKKRKLPPVSSSIAPPGPVDNPDLHQGRVRSTPHVDGQWAAHVYVSLPLRRHASLHRLIQDILRDARKDCPILRDIWPSSDAATRCELHVSLSRPIFLRAHQREDLRNAVKSIAKKHKPFIASFATLSELINDEKTRTFLTLEVGAGYHELRALADALKPSLQTIRQQEYYDNPRFHASIAWALLHNEKQVPGVVDSDASTSTSENIISEEFPSIAKLPAESIKLLNTRYGPELRSPKVGSFDVETISLKIGKEVYSWRLDVVPKKISADEEMQFSFPSTLRNVPLLVDSVPATA